MTSDITNSTNVSLDPCRLLYDAAEPELCSSDDVAPSRSIISPDSYNATGQTFSIQLPNMSGIRSPSDSGHASDVALILSGSAPLCDPTEPSVLAPIPIAGSSADVPSSTATTQISYGSVWIFCTGFLSGFVYRTTIATTASWISRTRLQDNIRKPKVYSDGKVRYGLSNIVHEPYLLSGALASHSSSAWQKYY